MAAKVTLKWNKPVAQIAKEAIGKDSTLFMANEARRLMDKYVPMETGQLAGNVELETKGNKAIIRYYSPYAHRLFYGKGFNFSKEKHTLATARWDEAMLVVHRDALVKAVQAYIRRHG